MKRIVVEFQLEDSWDAYTPSDEEKLKCLINPQLEGVKIRILKDCEGKDTEIDLYKKIIA